MMQLVYNTSVNQITETMSFFVNYKYNTNIFLESKKAMILIEQVNIAVIDMQRLHKELKKNIKFLSHQSVFYHNQHRFRESMLKKKDRVYLLWKNIKTTRSSSKLDHVKIESFRIVRSIRETSFELKLSEEMSRKHSVFYIFLLKSVLLEMSELTKVSDNYLMKQEEWYEVWKILKHKKINGQQHYLVKWKEYSDLKNTWELTENLDKCTCIIENYLQQTDSQIRRMD